MPKTYDEFSAALEESWALADEIHAWMTRYGAKVATPPRRIIPRDAPRSDWWKYADGGDLLYYPLGGTKETRIEVKGVSLVFSDRESFPFRAPIVDEAYKARDETKLQLFAYIIVNKDHDHCIWVPADSKERWYDDERFDSKEGAIKMFTFCPMKYVRFLRID